MAFTGFAPPIGVPMIDPETGTIAEVWRIYFRDIGVALGGIPPIDAQYLVATASAVLTNARNLGALASGYLKIVTAIGIATPSTVPTIPTTDLSGVLAATQFPALTGDVSTVAGALATTIGAGKVTNAMLAGAIAASKLVQTDLVLAESQITGLVADLAAKAALASTSTITTTGVQTALAIPAGTGALALFLNNATLLTLQGIAAGLDGQRLTLVAIGAGQVDVVNQSGSASAALRVITNVAGPRSMAPASGTMTLVYDATASRWRVVAHQQGAWITPTFAAGSYTGSGAMTWTVIAGNVLTYRYWLRGSALQIAFAISATSVGGTPSTALRITLPAGFLAASALTFLYYAVDNGAAAAVGYGNTAAGNAFLALFRNIAASGNWAAAAGTTSVEGAVTIEVT